jgi:sortase B
LNFINIKKIIKTTIISIVSIILVISIIGLCYINIYEPIKKNSDDDYIKNIAFEQDIDNKINKKVNNNNETILNNKINWNNLKKINSDIVGWLTINNTSINYPVLYHKGDSSSSQYYLNKNYNQSYSIYGSLFIDYRCSRTKTNINTIIHGHHMNDGSMFGQLMKYGTTKGNLDFYKTTPTISYKDENISGSSTYKIISIFKTTTDVEDSNFNYLIGDFYSDYSFMEYVHQAKLRSLINCPVTVNENDKLLTLSTCSYEYGDYRTVIVARQVRKGESKTVNVQKASLNSNPLYPKSYYKTYNKKYPKTLSFTNSIKKNKIDWYDGTLFE